MSPSKRYAKKQAKARQRRRLQAQERLERDRRQAQRAAEALHHALEDLGLPTHLVLVDDHRNFDRCFSIG
jgi:transcription initiation factor TFIIIB Brf1 subunit/transcription initiation factor TFIIB